MAPSSGGPLYLWYSMYPEERNLIELKPGEGNKSVVHGFRATGEVKGSKRMDLRKPLLPDGNPSHHVGSDSKHKNGKTIICIDGEGDVKETDFRKHHFVRHGYLKARDVLLMDPSLPAPFPSAIYFREKSIIISMQAIRTIICSNNKAYFISVPKINDPSEPQEATAHHPFITSLAQRIIIESDVHDEESDSSSRLGISRSSQDLSFPMKVLDMSLGAVIHGLDGESFQLQHEATPAVSRLSVGGMQNLEKIHECKIWLSKLTNAVQEVQQELNKVFQEDLSAYDLYLRSAQLSQAAAAGQNARTDGFSSNKDVSKMHDVIIPQIGIKYPRKFLEWSLRRGSGILKSQDSQSVDKKQDDNAFFMQDLETAEDILEDSYLRANMIFKRLKLLSDYIGSRELMGRIALDERRNKLVGLELFVSTISMGLGFSGMVAGVFGMNLWNTVYQESKTAFLCVMLVILGGMVLLPVAVRIHMVSHKLTFLPEVSNL